jgi:ankyrin repeat protein
VQVDGWTALMVATKRGHTDIAKLLLAVPGVDVNTVDDVSCVSRFTCML